ncbi:dienelactone hydrolase family protein [Brevibacillus choshinensis]|uniref:Dienelactone hydrolase family protein n=1 Tax=Brevibacillus choshinensis TaxID=54911 RepID=A0ABX7FLB4_BRECH|nr:dienelactone hydrolase family protein [Brevibacillus choshinensis]QRG66630.1 dienelactone hydrolase family protein [Brevibacillus choshinensis]
MSLKTEWVHFEQNGALHRMYTSRMERAKTPLPVVLVIQEIWGTDAHILDLTDRFAKAGFLAVAPDLYAVEGKRPQSMTEERIEQVKAFLETLPPPAWHDAVAREAALEQQPEKAREELHATYADVFANLKRLPQLLEKLQAAVAFLGEYELSKGQKVASTGYCIGGALSLLMASTEPRLAGSVVYYGHLLSKEQIATIQCPVLGFFGELDSKINAHLPEFIEDMKEAGKAFTFEVYEGAHHAFFNDTRGAYHVGASRDAWQKTLKFFNRILV